MLRFLALFVVLVVPVRLYGQARSSPAASPRVQWEYATSLLVDERTDAGEPRGELWSWQTDSTLIFAQSVHEMVKKLGGPMVPDAYIGSHSVFNIVGRDGWELVGCEVEKAGMTLHRTC